MPQTALVICELSGILHRAVQCSAVQCGMPACASQENLLINAVSYVVTSNVGKLGAAIN